jgi:hypothetical protein
VTEPAEFSKEIMMSRLSKPNNSLAEARPFQGMSVVNQHAAGVDIGAHEIMVCVSGPDNTQLVRSFGNYTADLYAIAKWLGEHNIWTVAMESTGVYWIPLFEILEIHKFQCLLISSRSLRRVPGRKSDVVDCQWIQTLHTYGLLTGSFRPEADLVALRTLLRHRARSASAEGFIANESPVVAGSDGCNWGDGSAHYPSHCGR